jgi:hypothetical protein
MGTGWRCSGSTEEHQLVHIWLNSLFSDSTAQHASFTFGNVPDGYTAEYESFTYVNVCVLMVLLNKYLIVITRYECIVVLCIDVMAAISNS